jgi:hypothetical protein
MSFLNDNHGTLVKDDALWNTVVAGDGAEFVEFVQYLDHIIVV